ncbi:hypothetical protein DOQ08_00498 [Marinobacter litoralis]|uniref:Uncharacterized protein n=1 Tax=Marinobacter litoralis TaxID=187981 RepID=A0A3M2RKR9_9GAMM|nr:hypothetical protein DOQ08_00498 [Marinobacter litoralis]
MVLDDEKAKGHVGLAEIRRSLGRGTEINAQALVIS